MANLEDAADVALVKIKELSAHVERAEAALATVEERLDDVKEQFDSDWATLDERVRALLDLARAQTSGIADDGEEARQELIQLDEALGKAASEWDAAIENGVAETSTFGAHVSERAPAVSQAGDEAEAAARSLAERAAAIEGQLQQAMADTRELLEGEVVSELKEMQEAVRQRGAALQSAVTDAYEAVLHSTFASWQEGLAHVEAVIDQEFASARQHAADVVEFSLQECRRGHEEAWTEIAALGATLEGLLQKLGESVRARTTEVGERRSAAEQALADAAAGVERMRSALAQELELMARYEFVSR